MATIHNARNDLEHKLYQVEHQPVMPRKKKTRARRNRGILLWTVPVVICILTIVYLCLHPEVGKNAADWVREWMYDLAWGLGDNLPEPGRLFQSMEDGLLKLLLSAATELLMVVGVAVMFVLFMALRLVLPLVVRIGIYLLPLAVGGLAGLMLIGEVFGWEVEPGPLVDTREAEILRAGLEGERQALSLLGGLDDACHIFTNLRIPYEGRESETDLIVVSPAGVTVVEVKNHRGTILGDASDEELTQLKRHDGAEEKTLYNPIRQVGTHTYRLAGYLRSRGINTRVRSCVLFVSDGVHLELTDQMGVTREKCPVFTRNSIGQLLAYVNGGNGCRNGTASRTVAALEELVQESYAA